MITDADIKKFKAVLATKNDLVALEKRIKKEVVDDLIDYMQTNIIPLLSEHDKRLDRLEKHVGGFPSLT